MTIAEMQREILRRKKERDVCILAHSYQAREILEIADITGDSYRLSVQAKAAAQRTLLMFGGSGLFSFPNFVSAASGTTDLIKYCIGVAAGCIFAFAAELVIYNNDKAKKLL